MPHPDFSAAERQESRAHSGQSSLKIAVVIASLGQPGNVAALLRALSQQSLLSQPAKQQACRAVPLNRSHELDHHSRSRTRAGQR